LCTPLPFRDPLSVLLVNLFIMMKLCAFLLASVVFVQGSQQGSPVTKVLDMLSDLHAKITKEGEAAQKTYDEFSAWCEDRSKKVAFEIKTGKAEVADLQAAIAKESATIASLSTRVEEIADGISADDADLQAATKIRNEEAGKFAAEEKELLEVTGMLQKAISILEREMKKGGSASMMQLQGAKNVADALGVMVDASVISTADSKRLAALVQSSQEDGVESELGAPAGAVYEGHSGGIVGTLQDVFDKAETQLHKAREAERVSLNGYQTLKLSLDDEIRFAQRDMNGAKKSMATAQEGKAAAEGDLAVTQKDLDEDSSTLSTLHQDCRTGADDFQSETKSRGEELKALSTAMKVMEETRGVGGAEEQAYSFVQVVSQSADTAGSSSRLSTAADLANFEAVRFVRDLARTQNSPALAQLAKRMASAVRSQKSGGADPFSKVKGLVQDMIEHLSKEAQADATKQAYCDSQTADATAKKNAKKALIEKLSTEADSDSAKSAHLKEQVGAIQNQLAQLAASQAEMDKIRSEEKALYDANSAEMKAGVKAVQFALKTLRTYYASDDATAHDGAGAGIVGMLEVVESDFVKGLAEMSASEHMAAEDHDKTSRENFITKDYKNKDVQYKQKEAAHLDKDTSEANQDSRGAQAELDATLEFLRNLDAQCVAKAETKAETIARREAEIAGLNEALNILQGEAVLLRQNSKRTLRGGH